MIISLKAQLNDWKYARGNTIRFLQELSDSDLQKELPRATFTTIYDQIAEMAWVQRCFTKAIELKTFANMDWDTPAYASKSDMLADMAKFDAYMEQALEGCGGEEEEID